MRKILKKIAGLGAFLLSLIINNYTIYVIKKMKYLVLTSNFCRKLKEHGKSIIIEDRNRFEGLDNVIIGNKFSAQEGLWLSTYSSYGNNIYSPKVIIGNNVHFSRNCHIGAINKIVIGDNVLVGSNVLINDHAHGESNDFSNPRNQLPLYSKGEIIIGSNTWIGDNAVILPGVHIGKNCIIGANAVVTRSFIDDCIVIAGNPAKVVKNLQ